MALLRHVGTIASWTLCSRMLGLIRDRLLAGAFGASLLLDAFLLAFALPNMLRQLFGEGALTTAFLPRYVHLRARDPARAEAFAGLVLTRLTALLGLIAGLGLVVAMLVASQVSGRWALVATLVIPQLPYLVFICAAALMAGTLNARRHFAVPAAAPVLLNLVLIAVVVLRPDIRLLPYGVLAAGILQAALHALALRQTGGLPRPSWRSTAELCELRRALVPTLIASSVFQLNALLDSLIAFTCIPAGDGAVTILYCANRLLQFPMALVAHGVGTALYPDLALAAERGYAASAQVLRTGFSLLFALLLPAALGLAVVAEPLVRTIYETGAFDAQAVRRCVLVTVIFAGSLLPIAINKILLRCLLAHRDQRRPLQISLLAVVINLVLNLILVRTSLREAGLAVASLCSALLVSLLYVLVLRQRGARHFLALRSQLPGLLASVLTAGVAAAVVWTQTGPAWWRLLMAVTLSIACYGLLMGRRIRRLRSAL